MREITRRLIRESNCSGTVLRVFASLECAANTLTICFAAAFQNSNQLGNLNMKAKMKKLIGVLAALAAVLTADAAEKVKVGVLHSLSGTMAISETSLKDILLFTFD